VIPPAVFSVVVMMSVATTLIVPPVLALLYREEGAAPAPQPEPAWEEPDQVLPEM
jgi:hypothetical protein